MAKAKRGPGRPKKTPVEKSVGKKRGRKPGIKNKLFLEKVGIQADALEAAINGLESTLNGAASIDPTTPQLNQAAGIISGLKESLSDALTHLEELPADFVPGKKTITPLVWEAGAFVVFTNETLKAAMPDAYEVLEVFNLGKGPGNGLMIRIEKGMFPKGQLELIDGSTLEDAEPAARPSARSADASAKRNGVAPAAIAIPVAKEPELNDDLNA